MSKEHDRIWLEPAPGADEEYGQQWCQHNVWGDDAIEYVRADLPTPSMSKEHTPPAQAPRHLRVLSFMNLDATPMTTEIKVSTPSIAPIMDWYGAFYAGDRYAVFVDGTQVQKDRNGALSGEIPSHPMKEED